jgi:beta-lactamase class A
LKTADRQQKFQRSRPDVRGFFHLFNSGPTFYEGGMIRICLVLTGWFLLVQTALAESGNLQIIRDKTQARFEQIAAQTGGALGVCIVDLSTGERFETHSGLVFPQASAIKIVIMMELFKQAHEGRFQLTDRRRIERSDKAGGSGILAHLGHGTVEMSLRDLCVLMIVLSDNSATNILIEQVGMENVNRTLESLGFSQTRLRRKMMDTAASHRGEENTSTPAEAARIMEMLFKGEFVSGPVCEEMIGILRKTARGDIKSGLPDGVPVAFKPGGISGVATEWALALLPGRPYVIVAMENYGTSREDAAEAFTELSRAAHEYFSRLSRATAYGTYVAPPAGEAPRRSGPP